MAARKSFKVRRGNCHLTVYSWTHPATGADRWRFAWRADPAGPWRYVTRVTKDTAADAAEEILKRISAGETDLAALPPARRRFLETLHREIPAGDEAAVLEYLSGRRKSAEIGVSIARFLAGKESAAGEETPYLRTVRKTLEAVGKAFAGRSVADIHLPDLQEWLATRGEGLSPKRRKDLRADLVQFWRWALREGIAGREAVTIAERLPAIAVGAGERRILTPKELAAVLAAVRPEWRAWVVLGAFAGMRPEEIAPSATKKAAKRGLRCEEIDFQFGVIRVPACVSKVNRPRIIPLSEACRAGLSWAEIEAGMTGPVVLRNPAVGGELRRLGVEVFITGWPQDALRHSYGSYRNGIVRSLPQVAEEMGTSEAMLHRHYHNPRSEPEGVEWFAVRPDVPICSDETEVNVTPDSKAAG